ncbi:hypothetical protein GCM10028778_21450 [Barrientosiimonas marina]|uniref:XapX domain-containing protein n=1 Tax=Lentibacillus kimchii TaxID=1542911 RepID=A0ABW2UWD0_9BACI
MNIKNIDRALFTGLFVGIIIFLKESLFPNTNVFLSMLISGSAALIGFLIGDKIFSEKDNKN